MPWSDYHPSVKQFAGLVSEAAEARIGTAQTNAFLKLAADAAGIATQFATFTSVPRLYRDFLKGTFAVDEFRGALDTFQRTGQDQGITGSMIAALPWSPGDAEWNLSQRVTARVEYQVSSPFGPIKSWFSLSYTLPQLTTVGSLHNDAQQVVDSSGTESPPLDAQLTGNTQLSRSA